MSHPGKPSQNLTPHKWENTTNTTRPILTAALPNPNPTISLTKRIGGNVALRILPLGDTLTYGGQSGSNGYRDPLRELLTADGNPVDYVGSQTSGTMADNQNEGWPGLTVSALLEKAKVAVPAYLPNLVLINAGASDCANGGTPSVKDTMLQIMQFTWKNSVTSSIVLSTVPLTGSAATDACIAEVNKQYQSLVQEQQGLSRKVVLVDFGAGGLTVEEDLCCTPEDYDKMAAMMFAGIKDAASRGWVEKPEGPFTEGPAGSGSESASTPTSKEKVSQPTGTPSSGGGGDKEADSSSGGSGSSGSSGSSSASSSSSSSASSAQPTGSIGARIRVSWALGGLIGLVASVMV
jgi:hypothetical protein